MSNGPTMTLAYAERVAETIKRELAPYCQRIEIAGSVRRRRPECGDIDLVLLPTPGLRREIGARVRSNPSTRVLKDGDEILQFVLHSGTQVDLYFARPEENDLAGYTPGNFGMRLLAMTGSKEHNVKLAREAKRLGLHFAPYRGLQRGGHYQRHADSSETYHGGEVFRGETEEGIFEALGLPWIPPEQREVAP